MTASPLWRPAIRVAALALPALFLISGCTSPEARLRTGLMNAGLSASMAHCMAGTMVDRLSTNQLMKLNSLSKAGRMDLRDTTYEELLHRVRALRDPEILSVTTRAAVACALTG
ncbi:MAG: hypothetical protein BGP16_11995 [Sphingobium sp. 66-54]|nr:MAG: hypothetical protein BGP16_11995 [Sphingobium sp. 66-54]